MGYGEAVQASQRNLAKSVQRAERHHKAHDDHDVVTAQQLLLASSQAQILRLPTTRATARVAPTDDVSPTMSQQNTNIVASENSLD
jgi:hypothetical protein